MQSLSPSVSKREILKKLVDAAGKVETNEAWNDSEDLSDAGVDARKEWDDVVALAREIGITEAEIRKCKARGIYLYETVWCGISEYE